MWSGATSVSRQWWSEGWRNLRLSEEVSADTAGTEINMILAISVTNNERCVWNTMISFMPLNVYFKKVNMPFFLFFISCFIGVSAYWFQILVTLFLLTMSLFEITRSLITLLPVFLSMLSKVFVKRHLLYFKSLVYVTLLALMDGICLPIQIYHHLQVKRLEDPSQGILYSQTSTWLAFCNFTSLQNPELILYLALFLEVTLGCISQLHLQISGMEQTSFLFQQASKVFKIL